MQNRSYEDKDGVKRNVTDIVADGVGGVEFLSSRSIGDDEISARPQGREKPRLEPVADDDDGLPF